MKENGKKLRKIFSWLMFGFFVAAIISAFSIPVQAAEKDKAQAIVDKAKGALTDLMSDPNFSWLQHHIATAKGVIIFPQVIKGGFFIGGSGGTGVLLARRPMTDEWSEPAFYTLGSVTFGLQIGGEAAEVVMLAMNQKALDSLYSSSMKLGGNASIALGPVGGGATGDVTADFVSFAKSKGLYAGINLEGSVIEVRDSLNEGYYGMAVRPVDIIVKKTVSNPGAETLRAALKNAASMKKPW
jgi:lipid-binding SYLF domain-containing protein